MVSAADLDMSGQMEFEEFVDFVKSYKGSSSLFQRLWLFGHLGRAGRARGCERGGGVGCIQRKRRAFAV
jgi:hypothetical protein